MHNQFQRAQILRNKVEFQKECIFQKDGDMDMNSNLIVSKEDSDNENLTTIFSLNSVFNSTSIVQLSGDVHLIV